MSKKICVKHFKVFNYISLASLVDKLFVFHLNNLFFANATNTYWQKLAANLSLLCGGF